jgi:hypothetical protein
MTTIRDAVDGSRQAMSACDLLSRPDPMQAAMSSPVAAEASASQQSLIQAE